MGILLWIIFGAIAGWIASMIMGTNARQGLVGDILLGIVGAVIGGFLMNLLGASGVTGVQSLQFHCFNCRCYRAHCNRTSSIPIIYTSKQPFVNTTRAVYFFSFKRKNIPEIINPVYFMFLQAKSLFCLYFLLGIRFQFFRVTF